MSDSVYRGRLRLAVASYDARFYRVCERYLACLDGALCCEHYSSGQALLDALASRAPYQAVLLDDTLADMDAAAFCRRLQQLDPACRPWLLLVPTRSWQQLCSLLAGGNVQPWAPRQAALEGLLQDLRLAAAAQPPQPEDVRRALDAWGAPAGAIGTAYVQECICLALRCDARFAVRKDVLQEVARRHTVSVHAVNSGIRRTIRALEARNSPAWQDFRRRHALPEKLTPGPLIRAARCELLTPQPGAPAPEGEPDERISPPAQPVPSR